MNLDAYLHRIGLDHRPPSTLEGLRAVHRAHLLAIPYENLDVQLGRPVTIERPAIFEKIVTRRRGGWCYEMNGMLGWALDQLGFKVTRATGAVMRKMAGEAAVANHLVLKVELAEGTYHADVGFGDGPVDPIPVTPGRFDSHGFQFDIVRVDENWWRLLNHPDGGAPSFDFNLDPADEAKLAAKCNELQTEPQSHFVLNTFCFRHRSDGIAMLRGRVLRMLTPAGFHDRTLESSDEFMDVLATVLGLDVPEAVTLWPKICARHEEVLAAALDATRSPG